MMPSWAPLNDVEESARLEALERLRILDTAPEREFDELVSLAARLCATPIATLTLIDRKRQWFKASVGLGIDETPREIAFCAWTILGDVPLIIEDISADPRFADNPLVTGDPHLRFYAGIPLQTSGGHAVGTLAVMDRQPRRLGDDQLFALKALAHQAAAHLELRLGFERLREGQARLLQGQIELEALVEDRSRELVRASARLSTAERFYYSLWETTTDAVLILDEDSIIQYANPGAERLFDHSVDRLEGSPLSLIQPPRLVAGHQHALRAYMDTGVRRLDWRASEATGLRANGDEVPIEISFSEIRINEQRLFVGFIRDITERKRATAALQEERERAQSTLRSIGDGVISIDAAQRVVFLNPMAEQLTGWTSEEAAGVAIALVLLLSDEASGQPLALPLDPLPGKRPEAVPIPPRAVLQSRRGPRVSVEGSVAALTGSDGRHQGWVVALRDVSHARRLAAQISFQASHDALTGLVNRSEFDRRLREAVEAAGSKHGDYSVLYLDLDQFKIVNDTCGHVAGDELLKQLASILGGCLRGTDTLARLGGDEFGVLLEKCPEAQALRVAEKLRDAVAEFVFVWKEQLFASGVSIGHVHFSDDSLPVNEILSKADEACYVAKDLGRNRIHTYRPGEEAQARRHGEMQWVGLIHQAFDEDRFCLFAQPVFAVGDVERPATQFEVLLRMRDREGALVLPMAFLPAAERYNLMPRVDRWVVARTFAAVASAFDDPGACHLSFAINLSGTTLGDASFAEYVRAQLEATGLAGACICFEITETAAIANLSSAVRLIHDLKGLGCSFSLDDFGSGLSSFAYLKHLPVDQLKIDGSFVRSMVSDPIDRAMVASINEIGHLMGLRTIAEFVENRDILRELHVIGVDFAQGYGLGRPVPLADFLRDMPAPPAR